MGELIIYFSYLSERGFSAVANLFSKKKNRLREIKRDDLQMFLTKIEPDIY